MALEKPLAQRYAALQFQSLALKSDAHLPWQEHRQDRLHMSVAEKRGGPKAGPTGRRKKAVRSGRGCEKRSRGR